MFLDDTACNLASLNLMKYLDRKGQFDVDSFKHAVDVTITAQEILVDNASYPTPKIEENSHNFRPLGLGYANLGALLMSMALPYDSDEGRDVAGAVTALMCGEAYAQSARMAEQQGTVLRAMPVNREADAGCDSHASQRDAGNQARPCARRTVYGRAELHGIRRWNWARSTDTRTRK